MPVVELSAEQHQMLESVRQLLPLVEAARVAGISRQAIDKGARETGPYLVWRVASSAGPARRFVDLGAQGELPNPKAWSDSDEDVRALVSRVGRLSSTSRESELILQLAASGLVLIADGVESGYVVPYPRPLQRALDRLTIACWRRGVPPPESVPDLISWSQRPVVEWLPDVTSQIAQPEDVLLASGFLTDFCREWAVDSQDVEGEVYERRLMRDALSTCRTANDADAYVRFRRLLIETPVITPVDLHRYCGEPGLHRLAGPLRDAYRAIPSEHLASGAAECCSRCGHLIVTASRRRRCSNDRCEAFDSPTPGLRIPREHEPLWLSAPIRKFISLPGRAELRLAHRIEALGARVALWPAFDAFDLLVSFANGEAWAVDVKDWSSAAALGRHVSRTKGIPSDPPTTKSFYVFPRERVRQRPEYVWIFRHFAGRVPARSQALGEDAFVRRVAAEVGGEQGVANA